MRLSDIRDIDREDISNFVWKCRCKLFPVKETTSTKTASEEGKGTAHEWVDYPPKQTFKSAARAQDRFAIKVYKVRDLRTPCISGRIPLKYHKIEVQIPTLVAALAPIVKKENCHLDINEMAASEEPFRSLWFCQDDIKELYKKTESSDPLKAYLKLLVQVLDDLFREMTMKRRNIQTSRLVDFRTAWTLFPRDSTVYSFGINAEFLAKVDSTVYVNKNSGNSLQVKTKVLMFNGEKFVWQEVILPIPEFEGNKPIVELDVKRRLTARGRKVLGLQGLQYRLYNGIALHDTGKDYYEKHNVQGRILLNALGYNRYHLAKGKREKDEKEEGDDWNFRLFGSDSDSSSESDTNSLNETSSAKRNAHMESREDDLSFISGMMGGYALKNKIWMKFYVEDVEPMVWNDTAFSHLVYDDQQKGLVLSFTLTAEAVADRTHRPLFYLQAEDLGINAASLGANIKCVFEMATEWNAVILLDEADVFMAERNPNDIHRNELVSIFLRELEYFRSIIFLTTNLYHTIDAAFRSRVSLHLLFQSLNRGARETVWRKFLQRLPEQKRLEASPWARRASNCGFKNAVRMVKSWCDHKGYAMTRERLESGIKVTSPHATKEGNIDKDLYE
ncbi:ATPase [Trichoderma gracile]